MSRSKQIGTACLTCGRPIPMLDGRSRRKKTCSRECRNALRRLSYTPKPPAKRVSLEHRFWSKVSFRSTGCWEWTAYRKPTGYGQIGVGRVVVDAHRLSWQLHHQEEIPSGLVVRHSCDNPPCVNPWHLSLGSHADNSADKVSRGRQAVGSMLPHTKLTDRQVAEIRELWADGFPQWHIAEEFGITQGYVSTIVNGVYRKAAI